MKIFTSTPTRVMPFFVALLIQFSCAKDSDLMADFLLEDAITPIEESQDNSEPKEETEVTVDLVSGTIETNEDEIAIFNITDISNSTNGKSTVLKNIVQPINGEIIIEKDSIIKYLPNDDFNGIDVLTYVLELVNEDNTTSQQETSIDLVVAPVSDVVNDVGTVSENIDLVIPILGNDTFENKADVTIANTTEPSKGTVLVNPDKTLTFTPYANEIGEDSFTYTTEISFADGSISNEIGTVTINVNTTNNNQDNVTISQQVAYWKELFDAQPFENDRNMNISLSGNGGDIYYFDVSAYVYMYQVTGQDSYMNFAMELFQNTIDNSVLASSVYDPNFTTSFNDNYYTWVCDGSRGETGHCRPGGSTGEVPLNELRGMRTVARMLWVLSNSSSYLAKDANRAKYDSMLSWFETNIWEKWESRGIGYLYRSYTHLSSHAGQIAWFLHEITGKQKYRDFYLNWSFEGMPAVRVGSSMRNQLREISLTGGNGYVWNSRFESMTGATDVSHSNAEVELMILGAEMNDHWTITDMEKLIRTFDQRIFKNNTWDNAAYYINGGGTDAAKWDHGWVQLGRFDQSLQNRLSEREFLPTYYYYQQVYFANMAYNQAYLEGSLVYP